MVASAHADIEGQDTSKGGEAPGADLRQDAPTFLADLRNRQLMLSL